jgi:hypothetical protein
MNLFKNIYKLKSTPVNPELIDNAGILFLMDDSILKRCRIGLIGLGFNEVVLNGKRGQFCVVTQLKI